MKLRAVVLDKKRRCRNVTEAPRQQDELPTQPGGQRQGQIAFQNPTKKTGRPGFVWLWACRFECTFGQAQKWHRVGMIV